MGGGRHGTVGEVTGRRQDRGPVREGEDGVLAEGAQTVPMPPCGIRSEGIDAEGAPRGRTGGHGTDWERMVRMIDAQVGGPAGAVERTGSRACLGAPQFEIAGGVDAAWGAGAGGERAVARFEVVCAGLPCEARVAEGSRGFIRCADGFLK